MSEEWNAIIGEQLRQRREEKGLTLRQLADKAGCHMSHVSQIENGKQCPSSHLLFKLGRALNCGMSYFYGPIRAEMSARF
jgi:transcriptional regulator with XRE-family HTH domain